MQGRAATAAAARLVVKRAKGSHSVIVRKTSLLGITRLPRVGVLVSIATSGTGSEVLLFERLTDIGDTVSAWPITSYPCADALIQRISDHEAEAIGRCVFDALVAGRDTDK
jgi:hypothetical protein